MKDFELQKLLERVESAIRSVETMPLEEASRTFRALIDALERVPHPEADERICYALGYCWYLMPAADGDEAERWLRKALELNPDHHYAQVLLAHHLFDQDCYGAARERFQAIPESTFNRFGQPWRDLKVREMLVCCEIYRSPEALSPDLVRQVFEAYLENGAAESPQPVEIVRAVVWATLTTVQTPAIIEAARQCAGFIEKMCLDEKFANELGILQRLAADGANAAG